MAAPLPHLLASAQRARPGGVRGRFRRGRGGRPLRRGRRRDGGLLHGPVGQAAGRRFRDGRRARRERLAGLLYPRCKRRWDADVSARPVPWYAEASVRQGAFATFLGLVLKAPVSRCGRFLTQWRGRCSRGRGDTCLLHTRDDALLRAFPMERGAQFNNFPRLVGSRMPMEKIAAGQSLWLDGRGQSGDRLWMMTDALAQWSPGRSSRRAAIPGPSWKLCSPLLPGEGPGVRADDFAAWIAASATRPAAKRRRDTPGDHLVRIEP